MKCRRCGEVAVIDLPRHNAAFCKPCFLEYFARQVQQAISKFRMFARHHRVMVAVSGGKDSLALWHWLASHGQPTVGLYIDLGIAEYSRVSRERCEAFAQRMGLQLEVVDVRQETGFSTPALAARVRRTTCSVCGLVKRYFTNRTARRLQVAAVATGHNLDDEASTLLGNVLHWQMGYLARQHPVLPAADGLVRRVKPLFTLTERETLAYCLLQGIDFLEEECPHARGATSILYKELLNRLELISPGTKHQFLLGFLRRARPSFSQAEPPPELGACRECGEPSTAEVCAYCRMLSRARRADDAFATKENKGGIT